MTMTDWLRHNEYKATWGTFFIAAVVVIKLLGVG